MEIRIASKDDINNIIRIYKSVIGIKYCTWNDLYPTVEDIKNDLEYNKLYVALVDDLIIGTVTVINDCDYIELKRIAINKMYHRHGYAYDMLNFIINKLYQENNIKLDVATSNISAINLYKKLGFEIVGKIQMFNEDYFLCEKKCFDIK